MQILGSGHVPVQVKAKASLTTLLLFHLCHAFPRRAQLKNLKIEDRWPSRSRQERHGGFSLSWCIQRVVYCFKVVVFRRFGDVDSFLCFVSKAKPRT